MEWTFGTLLWWMLAFFFWFTVVWMFITVFADIFRRDMSGWAKAGWIILIVLLPFLGVLIYMIVRPSVVVRDRRGTERTDATDEIARAAQLHDQGKITDDEFVHLKQQALNQ